MECAERHNWEHCPCTYEPCGFKGRCCECLRYHLDRKELTACCFPRDAEATYDRSFAHFARLVQSRKL